MFFVRPDFLRLLKSLKTDEDLQYSVETSRSISMWQSWDKRLKKPFKLITHLPEIPLIVPVSLICGPWFDPSPLHHTFLLGRARFIAQLLSSLFTISYRFRGGNMGLNPVKVPKFFSGLFAVVQIAITTTTIISSFKNLYFRSSHHLHVSFLLRDELNKLATCTSLIMNRIPPPPPKKILHNPCFYFSWVLQPSQDKLKTMLIELWETCKWRISPLQMYGSS